jgi:hypothetical protein
MKELYIAILLESFNACPTEHAIDMWDSIVSSNLVDIAVANDYLILVHQHFSLKLMNSVDMKFPLQHPSVDESRYNWE